MHIIISIHTSSPAKEPAEVLYPLPLGLVVLSGNIEREVMHCIINKVSDDVEPIQCMKAMQKGYSLIPSLA